MGLEALLSTLESRRADTPDTPCNLSRVSGSPAPIGACTLDTPDTPEIIDGQGRATASHCWRLHYPDREPAEAWASPPVTHAEILERHPDAIAAEPFDLAEPERACSTCSHRPHGWLAIQVAPCGNPVAAGLSDMEGVIRYHPHQGANCPAWLGILDGELERRIREMGERWGYSGDDLALALRAARSDTEGWRRVMETDEGGE